MKQDFIIPSSLNLIAFVAAIKDYVDNGVSRGEVVQKNGTLFCIKNAKNGSKENQENARTLRA